MVFQSVSTGAPIRKDNILTRHIKPAARAIGLDFVNWQVLRRSFATHLKRMGADVKDAQNLMRHSRASTTLDVYQQFIPESQRRVADSLIPKGHSKPIPFHSSKTAVRTAKMMTKTNQVKDMAFGELRPEKAGAAVRSRLWPPLQKDQR